MQFDLNYVRFLIFDLFPVFPRVCIALPTGVDLNASGGV